VTTLLLVRHALHDWLGRGIPGRMPGVGLNDTGHAQAREWSQRFDVQPDAIYSSPQQRAQETLAPLAARLAMPVRIAHEFDEIDFGQWTGESMERVQMWRDEWRVWMEQRSRATPPGGEPFAQVASRVMAGVDRLAREHPDQTVLVLSHGDVIKAAVASVLGLSLDLLEQFDVAPLSMSVVLASGAWRKVKVMNQALTGPLLPP
jgi:broad specificity phosphatase PhoE